MINETVLRRILYAGTGLVIVVTLILAFMVIPTVKMDSSPQATPEIAVPFIWIVIIIHLFIVAGLVWTILVNQRGGRIKKGLLIALGVVLLLLSLVVLDGATAYLDHPDPIMHRVAISMFICIACNVAASVMAFSTAWYSRRLQPPSK
jgi:tryptophan-rich sensory protein